MQRRVGKGAEVLNRSDKFLLFASDGFFGGIHAPSRPCMVELLKAVQLGLEMITVLEVEDKHLPLSPSQLYEQMCKLDQPVLDVDGTPVLDLKPYVPYCDAFPRARAGWIDELDGGGGAVQPDRLDYWPPPSHLQPSSSTRAEGEDADGDGDGSGGGVSVGNGSSER